MKVKASHTPSLTPFPLTSPSPQRCGEEGILQAAALAPVAETGESEDVGTRARPHCDGTGLCRAQIWRSGTHARKPFQEKQVKVSKCLPEFYLLTGLLTLLTYGK